jgi:thiol:disulfide interchange protein DsbD
VGPVLVGILTYVAKTQNLVLGFWLLFVFALGMGQLFLILGLSSQATKLLPKSGPWMETVKHIFGLGMLGAFFYFLQLLIPLDIFKMVFGVTLIVLGVKAGAFVQTSHSIRKGAALALFVFGVLVLTKDDWFVDQKVHTVVEGAAGKTPAEQLAADQAAEGDAEAKGLQKWHPYSDELLAQAKAEGKPVLIDFYADWCAACIELEKKTFPQPEFQKASERFYLVRFDATNDSAKLTELRDKFEIIGLPTVVFLDSKGEWVKDATIIAFQDAPHFATKMSSVK